MKIRCENCHSDFFVNSPASGDSPLFVTCTHCEYPNAVSPGGVKEDSGKEVYTQCFSCGRQMAHRADLAIPICADCQEGEEKAASLKEWMIRKASGQIYGPFDLDTLQTWIDSGKIDPDDEVAKVGGQWKRFEDHSLFSRFFHGRGARGTGGTVEVAAGNVPVPKVVQKKARRKFDLDWRALFQSGVTSLVTLAVCFLALVAFNREWFVVPGEWIDAANGVLEEQVWARLQSRKSGDGIAMTQLQLVLDDLRVKHPKIEEPSTTMFARGRTFFLQDTAASLRKARTNLEKAVLANPRDVLSLAALGEVYANSGDPELQEEAVRLVDEASRLASNSAEVHRARAAFLIATMHLEEARSKAREALKVNPEDGEAEFYIGMSYLKPFKPSYREAEVHFQKAVELDPRLHKAYHQLAVVLLKLHEYQRAGDALRNKLRLDPSNARALATMASLYETVGDYDEAIKYFEKAHRAAAGQEPKVTLDLAVMLYQAKGYYRRARALLKEIIPTEGIPTRLSLTEFKEALAHQAAILRQLKVYQKSLASANRALEIDASYAPALLQKGLVLWKLGQKNESGQAFKTASSNELIPEARAAIHYYLGHLAMSQDKGRDAVDELRGASDALNADRWIKLSLAAVHFRLEQVNEAISIARDAAYTDPFYIRRRRVRTLFYHSFKDIPIDIGAFRDLAAKRFYQADLSANYGVLLDEIGRRRAAIQELQKAREAEELNVSALLNLGLIAYDQGDFSNAVRLLSRMLNQNAQIGIGHIYLGAAYTHLNELDNAALSFQKAQRYERLNPVLYDQMGMLYVRRGDLKEAREFFLRAIEVDETYMPPHRHLYQYVP